VNYWELRQKAKTIIPRVSKLSGGLNDGFKLKEKGRKANYRQYSITEDNINPSYKHYLPEHFGSFAEVSRRAQSCPMPFNIDCWDSLTCPYRCKYCFADYFRHSLYLGFKENAREVGLRHIDLEETKKELDQMMKHRGEPVEEENEVLNAVRLGIPMRLGIRFEDFIPIERKRGISLGLLKYLQDHSYPVMINTKSEIPGEDPYVSVLSGNEAGAAIHFTVISSDEALLKKIEPGAPSFKKRMAAAKALSAAGVRVVARIEPWMIFINDGKDQVDEYIGALKEAGVKHMTFDSYSYSANGGGLAENFYKIGIDFKRMFLLSADSQWLSSLLLGKFIEYFRENGLGCSTFDQGNAPANDDWICCSVGDFFDTGWNWGSGVIAIKYIQKRGTRPTRWSDFVRFVNSQGGFLSSKLRAEVHALWNGIGDCAWPIFWGRGIVPAGSDENGAVWRFEADWDFRENLLEAVL
jgi:DNA repair photolyase